MGGRTISHYEVVEKLGAGGMGVVYKAYDRHLDRFVAIKVLRADKVADESRRRRFVQEAKAASALNHPNIITVHDIAEDGDVHFIAMELVEGKTLAQLAARKRLPLSDALNYAVQMADALAAAHSKGIVHRDLKPGNVMVTVAGLVKVLDFGLAKLIEPDSRPSEALSTRTMEDLGGPLTEEGMIVGTMAYMSPEQAEGEPVDTRSDIFSFGAVLYEMVTGHSAFERGSRLSTLSAILREDPKPVRESAGDAPPELERVINRCLRKDPLRRFQHIVDVKLALEELKEESDSGKLTRAATAKRRRRGLRVVGAAVLVAALGIGAWLGRDRKPQAGDMRVSTLTTRGGLNWGSSLSPDGKQVAFVWNGENQDNFDIYVQLLDEPTARRLTTNPAFEYSPVWSPDGLRIAFLRETAAGTDVLTIPAAGGEERRILTSTASCRWVWREWARQFCGIAWSPDGKSLAVVDKESAQAPNSIYLLDIESRQKRRLTAPPTHWFGDGVSAFSPDGRALAFTRMRVALPSDIYVLPLPGNGQAAAEPQRVTHDGNFIMGLDWTADGRGIVFATTRGNFTALWRVAISGGKPERVPVGSDHAQWPSVSRNGGRLAYTEALVDWNIWRAPLPGATGSTVEGAPARFIYSSAVDWQPAFSPDGKSVAFASTRTGSFEIWICAADGSPARRLTYFNGAAWKPAWSPDGMQIAFIGWRVMSKGPRKINIANAEGGAPRQLTADEFEEGDIPSWSHDGKWIYFSSDRGTGTQVWKAPVSGGTPVQVTRTGGVQPIESADGEWVYYRRAGSVVRIAAGGGEEAPVTQIGERGLWTVAGSGMYLLEPYAKGGPTIEFCRFGTQARNQILKFAGEAEAYIVGFGTMTVSPDLRWVLYEHRDRNESNIMLVENFR